MEPPRDKRIVTISALYPNVKFNEGFTRTNKGFTARQDRDSGF
ncbi:MAG: hypothetical protein AAFZ92_06725 [Pseudomonadota bacterium]